MSWYYNNLYKQSNSLAKSLGLDPEDEFYKFIQKHEKKLKEDGSWQSILNIRKSKGKESALDALGEVVSKYSISTDLVPIQKVHRGIRHIERSLTGGDWFYYSNDNAEKFELYRDLIERDHYDFPEWDEIFESKHEESIKDVLDDYTSYIKSKIKDKIEEINQSIKNLQSREDELDPDTYTELMSELDIEMDEIEEARSMLNSTHDLDDLQKVFEKMGYDEDLAGYALDQATDSAIIEIEDRKISMQIELKEQEEILGSITCGGHWCVSPGGSHIEDAILEGSEFLVLRRNGNPTIAIKILENQIQEIQGVENNIENLSAYDVLDLFNCPMFDEDEIRNEIGSNFESYIFKILDIPDSVIKLNKNILKSFKSVNRLLGEMIENEHASKQGKEIVGIFEKLNENLYENNSIIHSLMFDSIKSNYLGIATGDPEMLIHVMGYYDSNYRKEFKEIFENLPDSHLQYWFHEYLLTKNGSKTYLLETKDFEDFLPEMKYIFGEERISKFLNFIEDDNYKYFNLDSSSDLIDMILNEKYKQIDILKFVYRPEVLIKLRDRIRDIIYLNINGRSDYSMYLKLMSKFIDFTVYLKNLSPMFSEHVSNTIHVFASVLNNKIRNGQWDKNPDSSTVENAINELIRMGCDKRVLDVIYNNYKEKGYFKNNIPSTPPLIDSIPNAQINRENVDIVEKSIFSAKNWYNR